MDSGGLFRALDARIAVPANRCFQAGAFTAAHRLIGQWDGKPIAQLVVWKLTDDHHD
jgi:hypothetical protein